MTFKSFFIFMAVWLLGLYGVTNLIESSDTQVIVFGGLMYIYGSCIQPMIER